MIAGAVCMSHSPLLDRNRAEQSVEREWHAAVAEAGSFLSAAAVDCLVVFYPDHFNGFLYDMMPSFCIGIAGESLGDFGTVPGRLDIPEKLALSCVESCLADGVDVALSSHMNVDHGGVQPVELLAVDGKVPPIIPIFINCAAAPRPSMQRVTALGQAVGRWAMAQGQRIMIIGSGGLSHDPPLPSLASATGSTGQRLRQGGALSHGERLVRQSRVHGEGMAFAAGRSKLRELNPVWDREVLTALSSGDYDSLMSATDEEITKVAGVGGHEIRCWIAALSALDASGGRPSMTDRYVSVDPWLTGMGLLYGGAS